MAGDARGGVCRRGQDESRRASCFIVSSFDRDKDWSVRASLAGTLANLPPERVRTAIEDLIVDSDARVRGPALEALVHIGAPDLSKRLFEALEAPDFTVRATAARLVGETQPVRRRRSAPRRLRPGGQRRVVCGA